MTVASAVRPKLVIQGLSVAYGPNLVLDGIDLTVNEGEKLAVVGPSGSGKSTLLRAIAGLQPPAAGRILLDGRDLSNVPTHRRGVGLMFQDHALFPHLTVADNVAYGLRHGASSRTGAGPSESVARRVEEMLELVGLSGFGHRSTNQLSGGEAQRVALARALAPAPSVLMLDEPLGSLDRILREQLVSDLDLLLDRMGQTALHVTHDQAEAFALADRVAVLTEGRLVRLGTPQELWEDPGSRFVATFLGRPNILRLEPAVEGMVRWVEGDRLIGRADAGAVGAAVTVVVPIDAVHVASDGEGVPGVITSSQFHQGRYRHRLQVGSSGASLTFVDRARRSIGDPVNVAVDLDAAIPISD